MSSEFALNQVNDSSYYSVNGEANPREVARLDTEIKILKQQFQRMIEEQVHSHV